MKEYISRFSDQEYERRHQLVQDKMKEHGIDALIVPASESVVWLTGITFTTFDFYVLMPKEGAATVMCEPVIYRGREEMMNTPALLGAYWAGENSGAVEMASAIPDIRGVLSPEFPTEIAKWMKERGHEKGTIGVAGNKCGWDTRIGGSFLGVTGPQGLNVAFYNALTASLPDADLVDGTQVMWQARTIKSAEEIESIRSASKLAALIGENMMKELQKPVVTEGDMFAVYWDTLYRNGGGHGWWFMAFATPTSNPADYGAHLFPNNYTLQDGDVFIAEIVPDRIDGYCGHFDVTFVLGKPAQPKIYEKVNNACLESYNAVLDCMKPGVTKAAVIEAADSPLIKAGLRRNVPILYGLGLMGFEPPFYGLPEDPEYWAEGQPLMPGQTVNVISMVYDPDTNVAVRTGSTHLITENGHETLTPEMSFPRGMVCVER